MPDMGYSLAGMSRVSRTQSSEDIENKTRHSIGDFDKLGPMKDEFSHLNNLDIRRHVMPLTTDVGSQDHSLNRYYFDCSKSTF